LSENHDVLKKFGVEVCRFVVKKEESEGNVVLCEKDWKIRFDYNVSQRHTNKSNTDGNATQEVYFLLMF
jgi:hypothetical protein